MYAYMYYCHHIYSCISPLDAKAATQREQAVERPHANMMPQAHDRRNDSSAGSDVDGMVCSFACRCHG